MAAFWLFALTLSQVTDAQVSTAGLVGFWPFNSDAQDYSGNGNNGVVHGAQLTCDRCRIPNSAYYFNGTSDYIEVLNSPGVDMNNNNDFSISFWMKMDPNPKSDGTPLSKNLYGSWSGYQFFTNNTNPGYCTSSGHTAFYTASSALQDACSDSAVAVGSLSPECFSDWNFITGVYDATSGHSHLYVNGVVQADVGGIAGTLSNTVNLTFGTHPALVGWFKGALDDIRIYKRKLTQAEINNLYAAPCIATDVHNKEPETKPVTLFPNPCSAVLTIDLPKKTNSEFQMEVNDVTGKTILHENLMGSQIKLDLTNLDNGVYFIIIRSADKNYATKFLRY